MPYEGVQLYWPNFLGILTSSDLSGSNISVFSEYYVDNISWGKLPGYFCFSTVTFSWSLLISFFSHLRTLCVLGFGFLLFLVKLPVVVKWSLQVPTRSHLLTVQYSVSLHLILFLCSLITYSSTEAESLIPWVALIYDAKKNFTGRMFFNPGRNEVSRL